MNISIKPLTWPQVESFWRDHNALKSDVVPDRMCITHVLIWQDSLSYAKDKVLAAFIDSQLIACVRIETKHYGHLRIAALGKMAVNQQFRRNGLARILMKYACSYMGQGFFDISVLWASILRLYEQFGYVAIHKNMMVKWFRQTHVDINDLRAIPGRLGTW